MSVYKTISLNLIKKRADSKLLSERIEHYCW